MSTRRKMSQRYVAEKGRHTISVCNETHVRLQYFSGGVVDVPIFPAGIAVVRGDAARVNEDGNPLPKIAQVVCQRAVSSYAGRLPAGKVVMVIDPGKEHGSFVIPWGTISMPLLTKTSFRHVGNCSDTTDACVGCMNNYTAVQPNEASVPADN